MKIYDHDGIKVMRTTDGAYSVTAVFEQADFAAVRDGREIIRWFLEETTKLAAAKWFEDHQAEILEKVTVADVVAGIHRELANKAADGIAAAIKKLVLGKDA